MCWSVLLTLRWSILTTSCVRKLVMKLQRDSCCLVSSSRHKMAPGTPRVCCGGAYDRRGTFDAGCEPSTRLYRWIRSISKGEWSAALRRLGDRFRRAVEFDLFPHGRRRKQPGRASCARRQGDRVHAHLERGAAASLSRFRYLDELLHVDPGVRVKTRSEFERRLVFPVLDFGKVRLRTTDFIGDRL